MISHQQGAVPSAFTLTAFVAVGRGVDRDEDKDAYDDLWKGS